MNIQQCTIQGSPNTGENVKSLSSTTDSRKDKIVSSGPSLIQLICIIVVLTETCKSDTLMGILQLMKLLQLLLIIGSY